MGSPSLLGASEKELVDGLRAAGNKLLKYPSSIDELLTLLEKAENLLQKVCQQPPTPTAAALLPLMTALIVDDLSQHSDANVQVVVASCINELTRISAPDFPYSDDHMKGIFGLFMVAFEKLSCESGPNYERALQILQTVASVRSCLMMVDIECDALIGEMFQLFFKTIRSNHPPSVFIHMETIMTLVIQESDEISFNLLSPLLASVTVNNKNISPVSWELGEKVFRICAAKLKRYLKKAVESMNLDIYDYAEIVTYICQDTFRSSRKNMTCLEDDISGSYIKLLALLRKAVAKEVVLSDEEISNSEPEDTTPERKTANGNLSDNENSEGTLKSCQQELKNNDITEIQQQERDTGVVRKRRGRKPNSLMKPEEGYDHAWISGCNDFFEVPCNGKNREKDSSPRSSSSKELASLNKPKKGKSQDFFRKKGSQSEKMGTYVSEDHLANDGSSRRRGRPKKKESITVKEEKEILSDTDGKDELTLQGFDGSKQIRNDIIGGKHKSEKTGDKIFVSPSISSSAKAKRRKNSAPDKEKKSRRTQTVKNYGEDLVGTKIRVWWPMDKTFYPGTVNSFDPLKKKHKIIYEDKWEEILNLSKQRWELVDTCPQLKEEADLPSSATVPIKNTKKKTEKRKAGSSTEQENGASLSKRSKNKPPLKRSKSEENSIANVICIEDDPGDETHETNASPNDDPDRAKHAVKPEAEASMSDIEPNN